MNDEKEKEIERELNKERFKTASSESIKVIATISTGGIFLMPLALFRLEYPFLVFLSGLCFFVSVICLTLFLLLLGRISLNRLSKRKYKADEIMIKLENAAIPILSISLGSMLVGGIFFLIAAGLTAFNEPVVMNSLGVCNRNPTPVYTY